MHLACSNECGSTQPRFVFSLAKKFVLEVAEAEVAPAEVVAAAVGWSFPRAAGHG